MAAHSPTSSDDTARRMKNLPPDPPAYVPMEDDPVEAEMIQRSRERQEGNT